MLDKVRYILSKDLADYRIEAIQKTRAFLIEKSPDLINLTTLEIQTIWETYGLGRFITASETNLDEFWDWIKNE